MISQIKLTIKQIILNTKIVFKNISNLIMLALVTLIFITIPLIFIPVKSCLGMVIVGPIAVTSAVIFSSACGEYRNSTLYQNQNLSRSNRWSFNLSVVLTMLLFSYLVFILEILFLLIASSLGILMVEFLTPQWTQNSIYISLNGFPFIYVIYWVSIEVIIMYSLSFLFYRIKPEQKTYYSIVMSMLILLIIFGGFFNNYFMGLVDFNYDGIEYVYPIFNHVEAIFPPKMYFVSLLYPLYYPGQMINMVGYQMGYSFATHQINNWAFADYSNWIWVKQSTLDNVGIISNAWKWNILWIAPYIYSGLLIGISLLVKRRV